MMQILWEVKGLVRILRRYYVSDVLSNLFDEIIELLNLNWTCEYRLRKK